MNHIHRSCSQDKAQDMADLVRSSMSNHVPYLDILHSQLPDTRRSLSHHMLCHIAGTMDFSEDSSPFLGYQCDAGEQGLLPYPSSGPQTLGGSLPRSRVPDRRPRFFGQVTDTPWEEWWGLQKDGQNQSTAIH